MGKIYSGSAPLSKVYDVSINAPLDNRTAVRYIADLTTGENGGIAAQVYKGMIVYVQEDDSLYIYTGSSNSTWITSKGKLVNGGDINNWKKVDSFLDPSVNVEYYAEKIGARIFETEDELTGEIDSPHKGMFALVVGDSNESTIEETGLYILLDDDNTDANNWLRIDPDYSNFVVKDELDDYAKKSEIPDTSDLATKGELNDYIKKGELPDFLTDSDLDGYVKVEDLTDYVKTEDIADLASKSDLDGYVKVEDLVDFLTSSDLDDYATKSYVDKKITDIIGGAPETLDTLKEIAEALEDNATMTQVAEAISTKANAADVYTKTEVDDGFIGPNGAGKSTTIRAIMNLINKNSGKVFVCGKEFDKNDIDIKSIVGYLPSEINLYEDLTVKQILDYHEMFYKKDIHSRRVQLVEKLDLDETKRIENLSLGNRKKLGIILAFMHEPKLLILDEPTSGLDPMMQQVLYDLLKEEKSKGTTILYSTHILSEISKICDRVGIIKNGSLLKVESIDDIRSKNLTFVTIESKDNDNMVKNLKIDVIEKNEKYIKFKNIQSSDELIKNLANYKIDKILIEEASLDDLFLHYYE